MTLLPNAPGNTYLSEDELQIAAKKRGWKLSAVGQKPEVNAVTIHGGRWEPKGK